ncbi:MAG: hypothetical protein QOI73_926 [Solirubrobacteraceae bacterium]|nr:hypothetical protein [Solirubrobacteraceae bacterium]
MVLALALSVSPAAAAGIGIQLLDVPTTARLDPRARLYIIDHVPPGTVLRRRIEISNTTGSTADVAVYPAAAAIQHGAFLGAPGRTRNELSTWTSVSRRSLRMRANGHATVVVRVSVPGDAAPGERYGVVWAQVSSRAASGEGLTQVSRVGIRMYLSVGPGGPPAADFTIDSLTALRSADGRPMVLARVRNTGGRALDMHGSLRLRNGPGGLRAGPFPADLGVALAIGRTEHVTTVLDRRLPKGPWAARLVLRSGLLSRDAAATITFPDESAPSSGSSLGLLALIGGLLAAGVGLLVAVRARRRRVRA